MKIKQKNKGVLQAGFTLVEIMIVITLIGIVATLFVQNYTGKLEEGKRKSTKILMQQIRTALDDYYRNCNGYPTTAQGGLDALVKAPADGSCKDYDPNGYLKDRRVPKDAWDNDFIFLGDDGRTYVLKSLGADRKEGGEGNSKDISTDDPEF
ncbi:MAG TPA: type II secretion system major pseudopilin GspG [Oligoflexia bacterium]|nr:type II secretion system major pseudopilin GspG [Oligoflexia bacterium]